MRGGSGVIGIKPRTFRSGRGRMEKRFEEEVGTSPYLRGRVKTQVEEGKEGGRGGMK
jgi:hypothetical protein